MVIQLGEKVHVIMRRRFENDLRRHFVGEVKEVSGSTVRLQGKVLLFDTSKNQYVRKPEERVTIMDLAESGYIVNVIPSHIHIGHLKYILNQQRSLVVTDGEGFSLDINEFGANR